MQIYNNNQMGCQLLSAAYYCPDLEHPNQLTLAVLELAGAQTAVNAIAATAFSHNELRIIEQTHKAFTTDTTRSHTSFTARPARDLVHTLIVPRPGQGQLYEVITSLTSPTQCHGLYNVLQLYTPYPVLESWTERLFYHGERKGLIARLSTLSMNWAYIIYKSWDDLLDELAKKGELPTNG